MRDKGSPFSEFITAFLVAKPLAPHTKRDYQRYLERFDDFTGHTSLEAALNLDNATAWIEEMRSRGLFTANNACMALKSFASWIKKARYIQIMGGGSLLAGLENPSLPKSHRRAFTEAEMEKIYYAVEGMPASQRLRAATLIRLLVATGLRRNEARQILIRDLEIDYARLRGFVRIRAKTSKGNKDRVSRLDPEAIRAIDAYLNLPGGRPAYVGPQNQPEPIFLTREGKGFTEWGWSTFCDRIWDEIKKQTGIDGSSHYLRHTWATNYARAMQYTGNHIYDLQREGGWSDINIPRIYTHDRPEAELLEMKTPAEALRERRTKIA